MATNAAKLRDRSLPVEWIDISEGHGDSHPNARDAIDQAIRAGLDPQRFTSIQLVGAPEHDLPALSFQGPGGEFAFAKPSGCWFWSPVEQVRPIT